MSGMALLVALLTSPDEAIRILPGDFILCGPEARQTLVVERVVGGKSRGQVEKGLRLTSSNTAVVRIQDGVAVPVKNANPAAWPRAAVLNSVTHTSMGSIP